MQLRDIIALDVKQGIECHKMTINGNVRVPVRIFSQNQYVGFLHIRE